MSAYEPLLVASAAGLGVVVVLTLRDLFLDGRKSDFHPDFEPEPIEDDVDLNPADDNIDSDAERQQQRKKKKNKKKVAKVPPQKQQGKSALKRVIKVLRWFACPISATAAAWALAINPTAILSNVPSILSYYGASIYKVLPLHPRNLQDAFDLGEAHHAYLAGAVEEALAIAARIAGRPVDVSEIQALPQMIKDLMNEVGVVSRVLSVMTITNIAWFVAILGLTATIVPFVIVISKPLWAGMKRVFTILFELLVRLAKWATPLYEPLMYAASLFVLCEAARFAESKDPYGMTGTMLAVTSVAMFGLSWGLTTARNSTGGGNFEVFMTISWTLGALYCIPAAKTHQSTLIGYLAVSALAAAMKFSAFSSGLCMMIGFESKEDLIRSCFGCGAITVIAAVMKVLLGSNSEWFTPLESASSVIGTSIYLLGLDILCFLEALQSNKSNQTKSQLFYIGNMVVFIVVGELLGMRGMSNVGKTYFGIYLFTMYCSAVPKGDAFIIWLFALFGILYGGSLYLNQHPEYVAALFTGGLLN